MSANGEECAAAAHYADPAALDAPHSSSVLTEKETSEEFGAAQDQADFPEIAVVSRELGFCKRALESTKALLRLRDDEIESLKQFLHLKKQKHEGMESTSDTPTAELDSSKGESSKEASMSALKELVHTKQILELREKDLLHKEELLELRDEVMRTTMDTLQTLKMEIKGEKQNHEMTKKNVATLMEDLKTEEGNHEMTKKDLEALKEDLKTEEKEHEVTKKDLALLKEELKVEERNYEITKENLATLKEELNDEKHRRGETKLGCFFMTIVEVKKDIRAPLEKYLVTMHAVDGIKACHEETKNDFATIKQELKSGKQNKETSKICRASMKVLEVSKETIKRIEAYHARNKEHLLVDEKFSEFIDLCETMDLIECAKEAIKSLEESFARMKAVLKAEEYKNEVTKIGVSMEVLEVARKTVEMSEACLGSLKKELKDEKQNYELVHKIVETLKTEVIREEYKTEVTKTAVSIKGLEVAKQAIETNKESILAAQEEQKGEARNNAIKKNTVSMELLKVSKDTLEMIETWLARMKEGPNAK